jgi:GNAT superfamily N-acetyltransferase
MPLVTRAASFPHDYAAIADVLKAESGGWADTAEELAHADAGRDPRYHHATFVAEELGGEQPALVGVAFVGHDTMAHREGKFTLNLRVHPEWQGRGVGKALYRAALEHLAPLVPQELCADVWQAHPRAGRFLAERGFVQDWLRLDLALELARFDPAPYAGVEQRVRAQGITVRTYAELAYDPERMRKLYALDWALWQDVPYGQAATQRSLEQFATAEVNHPHYLPDACFVAVVGDDYIGYSNLLETDDGYSIDMTGVLRAYRGRGVATLLKLYGIRYAQARGAKKLWTVNDALNTPMLALNEKLGFVREGAIVRFVKRVSPASGALA